MEQRLIGIAAVGLINGLIVGSAAGAAWLVGKGDEWPWGGFGAAFGPAFGLSFVNLGIGFPLGAIVPSPAAFAAVYAFASTTGRRASAPP